MNLARHSITATKAIRIFDAHFDPDCQIFTACTPAGFAVYQTCPLKLIRKREISGGTLTAAVPLHTSNLLFLQGGGRSPRYPPNKVVIWDDAIGSEVAELEFRERVRGIVCRRGWLAVCMRRRVVVFRISGQVSRYGEWDTCDNPKGLLAIATDVGSTLLAIAGHQLGHVQLIHLPPCPAPGATVSSNQPQHAVPTKHATASIIVAHTTALNTLTLTKSGRILATTSSRGTLVRVWDTQSGKLIREFRRGTDKADIYGVAFRPDERELCVWSDKGTVHVFTMAVSGSLNRQSTFSPLAPFIPLPKYFESEWSYAQFRIPVQSAHIALSHTRSSAITSTPVDMPEEERCVVGWIRPPNDDQTNRPTEYQMIALTFAGGWYRLGLPMNRTVAPSSAGSPLSTSPPRASPVPRQRTSSSSSQYKGKEKDRTKEEKQSSDCTLLEFRRFGRWDGWG